jgi:HK97 family phage portal protein
MTGLALMASGVPGPADDYWYGPTNIVFPMSRDRPSADQSMQTVAVYACVRVLSETFGAMPFHVFRSGEPAWPGSERMAARKASDHSLNQLMRVPNKWQTGMEFREMMQGHVVLRGNAYAAIFPGSLGFASELIPKHPDRMKVFRLGNGKLGYLYTPLNGPEERYTQDEILHIRGFSIDGMVGISPIAAARNAIALSQQMEDHSVSFFANMAKPGGVLTLPEGQTIKDEGAHARLKKSWRDAHSGADLYSAAILENGMTWQQMGMSAEDSQLLENKRFSIVEIARLFRVSPHMIFSAIEHGHLYANVEQTDLDFAKHSMLPWVVRWEQAMSRDLIAEPDQFFPKFGFEGILRADTQARKEWYKTMMEIGVYNANDVLELEDRNPREDGETYFRASNLVPADSPAVAVMPRGQSSSDDAEENATAKTVAFEAALREVEDRGLTWSVDTVTGTATTDVEGGPVDVVEVAPVVVVAEDKPDDAGVPSEPGVERTLVLFGWTSDAATRIAKAELRDLARAINKAGDDAEKFAEWVNAYWGGRHADYIEAAVAPILSAAESDVTPQAVAATVAEQATKTLGAGDPLAVLKKWKEKRAGQLAELLTEAIRHEN